MKFYIMYAETCVEEYIKLSDSLKERLFSGCLNSEFQYLDHLLLESEVSEDGGMEFPDFLMSGCIPLVSERCKRIFDSLHIDNLFYKPINLTFKEFGIKESYWLALPPRINCLNWDKCDVAVENNEFLSAEEQMQEVMHISINSAAVGNYKIFKLAHVVNQEIIVTEEVKHAVEHENLKNVYFKDVEGENASGIDNGNFKTDF